MGEIIRFPRRPHWGAINLRFWNASLDRLTDYLAKLKSRETEMSDLKFEYPANSPLMSLAGPEARLYRNYFFIVISKVVLVPCWRV